MAKLHRVLVVLFLLASLSVFAQSADQQLLSATDSPDPIVPGNNITYTIQIRNNGPDPAVNGGLNGNLDGALTYVSASGPAGFSCAHIGNNLSCTNASFPAGTTATFTVVATVPPHLLNFPDGTVSSFFSTSGTTIDPNTGNNGATAMTSYDSPQIDLSLTVSDSPDPVAPDGNITYTIPVTNAGPDSATSVNFNTFNNGTLQFQSASTPPGWSCTLPAVGGNPTFTCTAATFAPSTVNFTVVLKAPLATLGPSDGTVSAVFGVNGTGNETNTGNNSETENTAYVTPDADMTIAVTDSPDPVAPDGNITYTVTVQNNGPDAATNANFGVFNNGSLQYQSVTTPAGWTCTPPAVNATPTFNCTNPSFANGASSIFTVVAQADATINGINDHTITTVFSAGSSLTDPNNANNVEAEDTAYSTSDADMAVTVSDSPDPVAPDGNITYTVTVTNNGPDTAPNATLAIFNNGSLQYQSVTTPAGWTCTPPSVNAPPTFNCTNPSFANGASSVFTVVAQADASINGVNDGTISTAFTVGSGVADPVNPNSSETENTAYVAPDADMTVAVTDAPDPVAPDGNVTYTITVTNSGPDTAPNATLTIFNNGLLQYQSVTTPAGWTCTPPAVNATPTFNCTNPSFANGGSSVFTLVAQADATINGINDHVIATAFTVGSSVADPDGTDNTETENTAYVTPDADISVTNSDSPDPVAPGDTITYTQSIHNAGPDAAPNATFSETLQASVGFQSLTTPAGWSCTTPAVGASGAINCTNASFASGATSNITLVVTVIASSGIVTNTVVGGSSIQDPDNLNNSATVTTQIVTPVLANLAISKTTNSDNVAPGSSLVYTITLVNNGPDAAANVVMTDTLPASLLFQSISEPSGFNCTTPAVGASGTITCTAATMPNGTTAMFTLIVQVSGSASGSINNTASATSDTDDNSAGNNSGVAPAVTVGGTGTADLAVTKTTPTTNASAGDSVSYTISVTNDGPNAANEVIVTDDLPSSLLFQSITPAATFSCTTPAVGATGTITCIGGPLANAATATFTLVATIAPGATGTVVNSANVSSSDSDPNGSNSTTTTPAILLGTADLSIVKSTNATQAITGSTINYTITVTNNGPDPATNVIVNDDLPAGLTFVSATPTQGSCTGTDPFSCNLGTLANGASASITLQALVTATSGTIANTASVTSDLNDDDPSNNSSTPPATPVNPGGAGEAQGIPTLSEWALIALAAMLAAFAMRKI